VWPTESDVEVARRRFTVLLGGLLVVQSWTSLAVVYVHLDDVLVLSAAVFALWAITRQRWLLTGLLLGVATAAKPWGIILVPLVLTLPRKERLRASLVAAAVTAASWGPFLLADSRTVSAGRVQNGVTGASVLHLFGVASGTAPAWVRPAQLALALVAGCWVVSKGRWGAVLFVCIALRIALDTQAVAYYDTGLVLAAFAWDLLRSRRQLPIWTAITFFLVDVTHGLTISSRTQAVCHFVATLAPVAVLVVGHEIRSTQPRLQEHNTVHEPGTLPQLAMESRSATSIAHGEMSESPRRRAHS